MFVSDNFILFVVVGCCCWLGDSGAAKQRQKIPLHELMTESEREYYFGTFNGGHRGAAPEYQLVYLPAVLPRAASSDGSQDDLPIEYSFTALGRNFDLELKPNRLLLSSDFKVFSNGVNGIHHEPYLSQASADCHYLHRRGETVAAISTCKGNTLHGVIVTPNSSFEIRPLSAALSQRVRRTEPWSGAELATRLATHPHLVRRAPPLPHPFTDDYLALRKRAKPRFDWTPEPESAESEPADPGNAREHRAHGAAAYTLEVALFMDEAAYNIFYPYLDRNEKDVRDMMLAYMNGVQALYHHPSLGTRLDISLVRLELQRRQPHDLPHYGGERGSLLDSFCEYQARLNEEDDAHPDHWDMALYVSGLDFFAYENGRKSGVTMGLATVGGVCLAPYACVIAELGATNVFGKPYPSAGFTSVYILAHEIGHNLGMHHDSSGNSCSKDGFIMSPSRGTDGETIWSPCSAQVMTQLSWAKCLQDHANSPKPDLDHAQHGDAPGVAWGAKRQCEVLLRDRDAVPVGATPCRQLQCRSPHRAGFYFAGPALPGTPCGNFLWCQGGECVRREPERPTPAPASWSSWRADSCASGCMRRSRGSQRRRRRCGSGAREDACAGSAYDVVLCDDEKLCAKKTRVTSMEFAGRKCREFSAMLPELDAAGGGLQAPHEEGRPWMGCAIFCRRVDSGGYYAPRVDLNDLGADPYFPDGTWCHSDAYQNYYCLQHHCLPENFKFTKSAWIWDLQPDDLPLLGNAEPEGRHMSEDLRKYLSLDEHAVPLTRIAPGHLQAPGEDEWIDKDYVELPRASEDSIEDN